MLKKVLFSILVSVFIAAPLYAVNTVTLSGSTITISDIDSDFILGTTYSWMSGGVKLDSVIFIPGAADDECILRDGSLTGPIFFRALAVDAYDEKAWTYKDSPKKVYMEFSDGTYSAGSIIILNIRQD